MAPSLSPRAADAAALLNRRHEALTRAAATYLRAGDVMSANSARAALRKLEAWRRRFDQFPEVYADGVLTTFGPNMWGPLHSYIIRGAELAATKHLRRVA